MSSFLSSSLRRFMEHDEQARLHRGLVSFPVILLISLAALNSYAADPISTTTSLAITSNGSTANTVNVGSKVTLTATVQTGSTLVTRGQVNFCDATATHCTDIHLLGIAQLNSAGKAVLNLRPGAGSYSYRAEFLGTPKATIPYAASVSSNATLNVTGHSSTVTTIAQSGPSGDYTLAASVYGFTKSATSQAPTGTVSFVDMSNGGSVLATANLATSDGPGWVKAADSPAGNLPSRIVLADFNLDGNADLAVGITNSSNPVAILLGDGKGGFNAVTSRLITQLGSPIAAADFNGDGVPDLLLSDLQLHVMLGNGDGTFVEASGSPLVNAYVTAPVVVADFNGDGIADIVSAYYGYVTVLLGNGDGTFTQKPTTIVANGSSYSSIATGDFDGDGNTDLAAMHSLGGEVFLILGNGDGTFKQGATLKVAESAGGYEVTLAAADFDGDGKPDLAFPIYGNLSPVAVLLNNGDGSFRQAGGSPVEGAWVNRIGVGDFNGDGIADLFLGAQTNGTTIYIYLGNGDGTFAATATGDADLPCCSNTFLGDLNGDGVADLVSSNGYSRSVEVLLTSTKRSTATAVGVSVTGQGAHLVSAKYPGDNDYLASESGTTSIFPPAAAPVITPASGIIANRTDLAMSSATPNASIFYQLSGAMSTTGYVRYSSPIRIYNLGEMTLQAYASATDYGQSAITTATYTVVVGNPTPVLKSMSPAFVTAGGAAFTMTLNGSYFMSGSTVYWGTTALATQYVSATRLTAQVTAAQISTAGVAAVTVQNPAPGGGASNALQFEVDPSGSGLSPTFTTSTATVTAGSAASYPVTLSSSATNVSVTCLNLPAGATCSYSASAHTLTIATTASTPAGTYLVTAVFHSTLPGAASIISLAALVFLPLIVIGKGRTKRHLLMLIFMIGGLLLVSSSCGGGSTGNGPVTPNPTHQVTSSGVVTLNVQ